ncbi:hypothetical protein [Phaeobacter piscinae]|uniref:hypothetical protein n=1 Tax=Phaeobacter piscinae TaxID=1580596 RepID=UPI00131415E4|nr:hypothetical protein [Phaeobacter piscinae]
MLIFQDDETGETYEQELRAEDITSRSVGILNAAATGKDVETLFEGWRKDLYDEVNNPK